MRAAFSSLLLAVSVTANAQTLNTFSNGQVADANAINENFSQLKSAIENI